MHQYALHYYQHATALRYWYFHVTFASHTDFVCVHRPYDVRLWQAQGMCYEEIGRFVTWRVSQCYQFPHHSISRLREAIECLKRALIGADPHETSINLKLAKLHNDLEEFSEAAAYHRRVVEVCRANGTNFSQDLDLLV